MMCSSVSTTGRASGESEEVFVRDEGAVKLGRGARSRMAAAVVAATALSLLVGCSNDPAPSEEIDSIKVTGEFGSSPTLEYTPPLEIEGPDSQVIWAGDGPVADEGQTVLLNLYAQDGSDGSQLVNTFFELPEIFQVTPDSLGGVMFEAIEGQQAGARVLVTDKDDGVPVVLVLDVLAGRAVGEEVSPEKGMPTVERDANGEPRIKISKKMRKQEPGELHVRPVIRGAGRQVTSGQTVIVQYTAVSWSDGKVIDSTWQEGRAPFTTIVGGSRPIPAWDEALIEQTVGSQILLIAPPALAYEGSDEPWADDAIVFVIDILYAGSIDVPEVTGEQNSDEGLDLDEPDLDNSSDK